MIIEKISIYVGFSLTVVGAVLLFLVNWALGFVFTLFVVGVVVWYLQAKRKGDLYLKEVARSIGCTFEGGGFGYGRVYGTYKDHEIGICVDKTYDARRGLSGFILSEAVLKSAVGVVAGMKNFTRVEVRHKANIDTSFRIDDRTYVGKNAIVYLPLCDATTGLPKCDVASLTTRIGELVEEAKGLTLRGSKP